MSRFQRFGEYTILWIKQNKFLLLQNGYMIFKLIFPVFQQNQIPHEQFSKETTGREEFYTLAILGCF